VKGKSLLFLVAGTRRAVFFVFAHELLFMIYFPHGKNSCCAF